MSGWRFPFEWRKGDEEACARFEKAVKLKKQARVAIARELLIAWTDIVLGKQETEFEQAAKTVEAESKKKAG